MTAPGQPDLPVALHPEPGWWVLPSRPTHLALRMVLVVLIALGLANALRAPAERPVDDLFVALGAGQVTSLTIERPASEVEGRLRVQWTGDGRPGVAWYQAGAADVLDDGDRVLRAAAASPRDVSVARVTELPSSSTPTWLVGLSSGTLLAALALLVAGPEPRVATRWAWFWLGVHAWPLALVYLVVEPTPLGSRRVLVAQRRLTGGWSFLLSALLLGPWVMHLVTGS